VKRADHVSQIHLPFQLPEVMKAELFLRCVNEAPRLEDVLGSRDIAPPFVSSALGGDEFSTSRPRRFIPGERAPDAQWIQGWVGPIVGLDAIEKRKKSCPFRESNPGRPARSP
jgi:hypothetical protein